MTFSFRTAIAATAALTVVAALGCARSSVAEPDRTAPPAKNIGRPAGPAYFFDFRQATAAPPTGLVISDFDFHTPAFAQVHWTPNNVTFGADGMRIIARHERKGKSDVTSGEVMIAGFYGYGRYEAVMSTARASGLDSAFFIHTYPALGDPHDEIDMEFVGSQPNSAFINYFREGTAWNDKWAPLGFDPSAGLHLYAFEWAPESIRWFVDGTLVAERRMPVKPAIPSATQRPFFNLLAGAPAMSTWLGPRKFDSGAHMRITCTSHVPIGQSGKHCSGLTDLAGAPH